jgi:hypothetical protein
LAKASYANLMRRADSAKTIGSAAELRADAPHVELQWDIPSQQHEALQGWPCGSDGSASKY